jgi:NADPH-dependent 2,4-dienoyl-CoA reductase/sulfur reductase-like enzyme
MKHYDYLIVGGGMCAAAATEGIRSVDKSGTIGMFSRETDPPYNRPPLSKGLWKGKSLESIWRKMPDLDLHLGSTITEIDPEKKRAKRDDGSAYTYGKLLLATGGTPRLLPFEDDQAIYYRTLADYRRLRALTGTVRRFAVIGGGFIGSEVAAALAMNGQEVVMIFPGKAIGERIFPTDLAQFVSSYYQKKGVTLLPNERVVASEARGDQRVLKTAGGQAIAVDGVVAGIGIAPNVALAEGAGLETKNGIVVDVFLRSSKAGIYAAGDVASFPSLGSHRRVEHEDNANSMGRVAGRNMAGLTERYDHLPSFYSDMFELGYEAVGELDSRLEHFGDWKRPNEEGVVYYLDKGRVRGVLLWNVWGKVDAARALIAEPGPFSPETLRGRLA